MKLFGLIMMVLVLVIVLVGGVHSSHQQDTDQSIRIEALDSVMKDTQSSLLQIANALVELEVSIQALKDVKIPDLNSIQLKKDHQQEILQIQTTLQNQLNSYESKAGYKSGSVSCASIASQLKNSMKEGQYWIYPVQKPMRVKCKIVGNEWTAMSVKGVASNPDIIVGPNPSTGIYSSEGNNLGVSINGKEMLSVNGNQLGINGNADVSSLTIDGQIALQKPFTITNNFNFTTGEWGRSGNYVFWTFWTPLYQLSVLYDFFILMYEWKDDSVIE